MSQVCGTFEWIVLVQNISCDSKLELQPLEDSDGAERIAFDIAHIWLWVDVNSR